MPVEREKVEQAAERVRTCDISTSMDDAEYLAESALSLLHERDVLLRQADAFDRSFHAEMFRRGLMGSEMSDSRLPSQVLLEAYDQLVHERDVLKRALEMACMNKSNAAPFWPVNSLVQTYIAQAKRELQEQSNGK